MGKSQKIFNPCSLCKRFATRAVTIDALIVNEGKILLIKRGSDPYKGLWALPGGFLDWNEDIKDCVRREVKEETGLEAKSISFFHIYSKPARSPVQTVALAYIVEAIGKPKAGDDALEYKFFPLDSLPEELAFDHKEMISDYVQYSQTK